MSRCVVFILLFAAANWAGASQGPVIRDDEAIRKMLSTRVDLQKQATGIVVGVIDYMGSRIVSYGTMGLSDRRPVNGDTVFDVGSITKVLTALLLADMAQRDEVNLDDPAAKYLDAKKVKLPERGGKQITLIDLATHMSGLPLRPTNLVSKDPNDKYRGYTVDLMYECLSSFTLPRDIGTKYEYSNIGYGLLGHVLEKRMGKPYGGLVESRITQPLEMKDTHIGLNSAMKSRMAAGYNNELTPIPSEWHFGVLQSAGAFSSTANDLLKFLGAVLGFKQSPLQPAMKSMLDIRRPGGMQPSTQIALAWNVYIDGEQEVVWKNGSVGGYRSFISSTSGSPVGRRGRGRCRAGQRPDCCRRRRHRLAFARRTHSGRPAHSQASQRNLYPARNSGSLHWTLPVFSDRYHDRDARRQPSDRTIARRTEVRNVCRRRARLLYEDRRCPGYF